MLKRELGDRLMGTVCEEYSENVQESVCKVGNWAKKEEGGVAMNTCTIFHVL